ncbi:MAG: hypothetical protein OXH27_00145 [Gammaproteobacteria bacterium]|nr:hypothetical protein [Gammaproteobacteria bacterium]
MSWLIYERFLKNKFAEAAVERSSTRMRAGIEVVLTMVYSRSHGGGSRKRHIPALGQWTAGSWCCVVATKAANSETLSAPVGWRKNGG